MVSKLCSLSYIEAAEQVTEIAFQSLEPVESVEAAKKVDLVVASILKRVGFEEGKGLGARLQGIKDPINLPKNLSRQGLGYEPSLEDQMKH